MATLKVDEQVTSDGAIPQRQPARAFSPNSKEHINAAAGPTANLRRSEESGHSAGSHCRNQIAKILLPESIDQNRFAEIMTTFLARPNETFPERFYGGLHHRQ